MTDRPAPNPIERRMLADPVFDRAYKTLYAIATGQFGEGPAMDLAAATLTRLDVMAKEAESPLHITDKF